MKLFTVSLDLHVSAEDADEAAYISTLALDSQKKIVGYRRKGVALKADETEK